MISDTNRSSAALRAVRILRAALVVAALAAGFLASSKPAAAAPGGNRMIVWTSCADLPALSDAALDEWQRRGAGGFACNFQHLRDMGGTQDFTGDLSALDGSRYDLERRLRDSRIGERLAARGMKAYLGFYLVNYFNSQTPLADWFDDAGWSQRVLPKIGDVAAAARSLGFAGVAFDTELYGQSGGQSNATWDWNYPGNGHSEGEVRAKARQRGAELMDRLVSRFPDIEVAAYGVMFPDTWAEVVQEKVNGFHDVFAPRLDIDFWNGLAGVEGYRALRLWDATFYKMPHLGSWDSALQYNYNKLYSYLSRKIGNWDYASSRLYVSPFAWIDAGPSDWERARDPGYVAAQLRAFRKWSMGGEFGDYAYGGLGGFDYGPYASAMAEGGSAEPDASAPSLTVTHGSGSADAANLAGVTRDNLAIRSVRWSSDSGARGSARLTWDVLGGDYNSGYEWQTRWAVSNIPLRPGPNRICITSEDIKGLTTSTVLTVQGPGGAAAAVPAKARRKARRKRRKRARPHAYRRSHARCSKKSRPGRCAGRRRSARRRRAVKRLRIVRASRSARVAAHCRRKARPRERAAGRRPHRRVAG
jgi:hypothetical protein